MTTSISSSPEEGILGVPTSLAFQLDCHDRIGDLNPQHSSNKVGLDCPSAIRSREILGNHLQRDNNEIQIEIKNESSGASVENRHEAKDMDDSVKDTDSVCEVIVEDNALSNKKIDGLAQITKEAQKKLFCSRMFLLVNLFANVLGLLMWNGLITIFTPLCILLAISALAVIFTIFRNVRSLSRKQKFWQAVHILSLSLYIIFVILRLKSLVNTMLPGFIPGCVMTIIESCFFRYHRSIKLIELSWLLWIQLCLVGLKIDGIPVSWALALFLANFFLFVTFLMTGFSILLWILTLYGGEYLKMKGRIAVVGSTWNLLLLFTMTTWEIEAFFLQSLLPFSIIGENLWCLFISGGVLCASLMLLSLVFQKQLIALYKEQVFRRKLDAKEISQFEYKHVFKLVPIDKVYLVKVSSTYFSKEINVRSSIDLQSTGIGESSENIENNNRLEKNADCIVCFERKAEIVFMDCGHGGLCCLCAIKQWKESQNCHICRGGVVSLVKIKYLPDNGLYLAGKRIVMRVEKEAIVI